jgi:hypothetical protein
MTGDAQQRELLPLACTLTPTEGRDRIQEWRTLFRQFGAGRDEVAGRLTLHFRDAPGVAVELAKLVEAERQCCAFLEWHLERIGEIWTLRISGAEDAVRTLSSAARRG